MIRSIAVVTNNYPSVKHSSRGVFVQKFADAMVDAGVCCHIIHPRTLGKELGGGDEVGENRFGCSNLAADGIQVLRPLTLSLSNKQLGPLNTFAITHHLFREAALRALKKLPVKPDVIYGHFLYSGGAAAVYVGGKINRPVFVGVGEGTFWSVRPLGVERAKKDLRGATGFIAVSNVLRQKLIQELHIPSEKIAVFPNGVDLQRFFPRDRMDMRKKHGLPPNKFLTIYVGNFIEPKGVMRTAQAIDSLPGVAGIFVGAGPLEPRISNLAFCGKVPHHVIPELLSAADCFVLPSDVEGSSNATLEALACGLPVIVSNGEFNDELVNGEVAIRVPHLDISAIREAVNRLREQTEHGRKMAAAARARAEQFDIRVRAAKILGWMESKVGEMLSHDSRC